jgi:hypothetical protein
VTNPSRLIRYVRNPSGKIFQVLNPSSSEILLWQILRANPSVINPSS